MNDSESVIKGLACCIESYNKGFCPDECEYRGTYPDCEQGLMREARELLKEQNALLNKIYNEISEWGLDSACDDLVCDDGWCDEHCDPTGTKPECIERWFKYLLKQDGEVG